MPQITAGLVRRLVRDQFPQWADLPVRQVLPGGWDNRTFRLGDELSVRLPSRASYIEAVEKEQRWLPVLAPQLPFPIPEPVALGEPVAEFPWPWSVYRWLHGQPASREAIRAMPAFARDVARFMTALVAIDASDGPLPGAHNFWRGASPEVYDAETRHALIALAGSIDTDGAQEVWHAALVSRWEGRPVWFHGDIAIGNLLLRDGELAAVIDFGTSGVGDPACDLVIAWTLFDRPARAAFREALGWDDATWARGRGWAIWKALIVAADPSSTHDPATEAALARRVIDVVIADHRAE